ncbi:MULTISPECIES: stage III sporulation protein AA [Bacillaceae]|uniref:Stage III sporulation protein AA n=1 Tax=Oceanobacillus caeni TaxID=405946 RepID=A0ABR5MKR1_9BACI|nr:MULTISPECIES: stage III sporulation protein AA [Bacillaceae]KKE80655.1 stage III sporulation protein AA [Bacilli bacterium VT-13-104]KPH76413.1 stage III sporulation protein AA [Oceanobacillus caeni]MED4473424.1 stage III sporulation protein AA [Oceanobacillus caeni]
MEEILRLFPNEMRQVIETKIGNRWDFLQEIRIRLFQPIEFIFDRQIEWITHVKPSKHDGVYIVNQLSEFSLYRMTDELREGYITIEGGHRVGIAGRVNTIGGSVKALQYITFFNIRIAKQKIGVANAIIPYIFKEKYLNTLLVGAPQTGKTTLIRDTTRLISSGWGKVPAQKVGVIDERSEIAASINGIPQLDLGTRTDVMDACPKAEGMMMMIRSMSPDVLVVDEIGSADDINALIEAINTGVTVICTIHGQSLIELKKRPSLDILFQHKVFERFLFLEKTGQPSVLKKVYDQNEKEILQKTRFVIT